MSHNVDTLYVTPPPKGVVTHRLRTRALEGVACQKKKNKNKKQKTKKALKMDAFHHHLLPPA